MEHTVFPPGYLNVGAGGFGHDLLVFLIGVVLFFLAPWTMRLVVGADRVLMRSFLGPDPVAVRLRALEQARTQTIDASAATLRASFRAAASRRAAMNTSAPSARNA